MPEERKNDYFLCHGLAKIISRSITFTEKQGRAYREAEDWTAMKKIASLIIRTVQYLKENVGVYMDKNGVTCGCFSSLALERKSHSAMFQGEKQVNGGAATGKESITVEKP